MFKLRNKNEIWYKSELMSEWINYGNLIVVEPVTSTKFVIKKFDLNSGEYVICKDYKSYLFDDNEYIVTDGYFEIEIPPIIEKVYQPTETELTIMETQADMYETEQNNNLIIMETLADIYETIIGGK